MIGRGSLLRCLMSAASFAVLAWGASASIAFAQAATGAISGRVLVEGGPSVAGATVTARNVGDRIPAVGDLGGDGRLSHRSPPGGLLRCDRRGLGVRDGARGGRGRSRIRVHERGLRPEARCPGGRGAGATGTGGRSASGPHEEGPADADLRIRHDGPDLRLQAGQSGLVRRRAPDEAAVLSERVRRERQLLGERAAVALRRARMAADGLRRDQDGVRVRPLRGQPRRGPDDVPPAAGWGELGPFLAGQTYSVFMDGDVFPNTLEYWGPNGMVFYRNVQLRWTPMPGDSSLAFALERPGATGDSGKYSDRIELQNIKGHFPYPDFTAHYRYGEKWGHVQLAGIVRYIGWTDTLPDQFNLSGHAIGWGLNLSSVIKVGKSGNLRLEATYGQGVENYMNDAPVDVGMPGQPGQSAPADPGQGASRLRHGGLLRLQLERLLLDGDRLFAPRHRQQQRPGADRLQERAVRARPTFSGTPSRT